MRPTPRAASSRAAANPAMPPPMTTTSAVARGLARLGPVCGSHGRDEVAQPDRAQRRASRRQALRGDVRTRRGAEGRRERLKAVLALARAGEGAGPALDQLRIAVAGVDLRADLVSVDVLAEADDALRPPGRARRRVDRTTRPRNPPPTATAPSSCPPSSRSGIEHAIARLDAGAGGEDEVEIRGAVTDDDEVHRDLRAQPPRGDDRPGDPSSAGDRREDGWSGSGRRLRPPHPRGRRRWHPGPRPPRRAGHAARAGRHGDGPGRRRIARRSRRDDRHREPSGRRSYVPVAAMTVLRADRPQRRVVDGGDDAVIPADGRRPIQEPDGGVPGACGRSAQAMASTRATRRPFAAASSAAAAPPTAAAHHEHVDLEVSGRPRPHAGGLPDR